VLILRNKKATYLLENPIGELKGLMQVAQRGVNRPAKQI
jgi:hypothetical protein